MVDIFPGTKDKSAAVLATEMNTDASKINVKKVLYVVPAVNTAGRAKMIVCEDTTKNGAWALREKDRPRAQQVSQRCLSTVGQGRSRSKRCGASGSRRSQNFHKTSTKPTELASNRATDDQRIVTTR